MARFQRNGGRSRSDDRDDRRSEKSDKPVHSIEFPCRGGTLSVAIWENTIGEGKDERLVYMFTHNRSYNDGKDWQDTKSVRPEDAPILIVALQKAFEWTLEQGRP